MYQEKSTTNFDHQLNHKPKPYNYPKFRSFQTTWNWEFNTRSANQNDGDPTFKSTPEMAG